MAAIGRALETPTAQHAAEAECWANFWEIIGEAAYRIWCEDSRGSGDGGLLVDDAVPVDPPAGDELL